jgi:DNA-binding MarR family transcriptional regulator
VRFGALAILSETDRADFAYLKSSLDVTDGNLSTHLKALEQAGYVSLAKEFVANKPRTWVAITTHGRQAFESELELLRGILNERDGKKRS